MSTQATLPYLNSREDEAFGFLGIPTQIRSTAETTNGSFGLIEQWLIPPGFASPYHTHHREDEAFYVLEGEIAFVCDGEWSTGGPGTYVFGSARNPSWLQGGGATPSARMLLLCAPGGFERFFFVIEMGEPASDPSLPPSPPDMAKLDFCTRGQIPHRYSWTAPRATRTSRAAKSTSDRRLDQISMTRPGDLSIRA